MWHPNIIYLKDSDVSFSKIKIQNTILNSNISSSEIEFAQKGGTNIGTCRNIAIIKIDQTRFFNNSKCKHKIIFIHCSIHHDSMSFFGQ